MYSNIREVWVDPVTGAYLDVREQQLKELVPDDGTDGPTVLLRADFKYTAETVTNSVKSAQNNHFQLGLVNLWGPIGVGIVGLLSSSAACCWPFRRGRSATRLRDRCLGRVPARAAAPTPRRRRVRRNGRPLTHVFPGTGARNCAVPGLPIA